MTLTQIKTGQVKDRLAPIDSAEPPLEAAAVQDRWPSASAASAAAHRMVPRSATIVAGVDGRRGAFALVRITFCATGFTPRGGPVIESGRHNSVVKP